MAFSLPLLLWVTLPHPIELSLPYLTIEPTLVYHIVHPLRAPLLHILVLSPLLSPLEIDLHKYP